MAEKSTCSDALAHGEECLHDTNTGFIDLTDKFITFNILYFNIKYIFRLIIIGLLLPDQTNTLYRPNKYFILN